MKVLHVAESIWGGCGSYLNEIIPFQLADPRIGPERTRILVPDRHVAHLSRIDPRTVVTFKRPGRAAGLSSLLVSARREIDRLSPDLIHAHSTFAGAIIRLLSLSDRKFPPIVYCPHGWVFDVDQAGSSRKILEKVERLLAPLSRQIVAISQYELERGAGIGIARERMVLVENGIAAEPPAAPAVNWADPRLRVLFIGRLDRQKGIDVLAQASSGLAEQITVRVIGEAVLGGKLPFTPPPNMEFVGWCSPAGVAAHLESCDVVAMPSRWEGFGLVAVEAMRAKKPVIASKVGGLSAIVQNNVTGILVERDDPEGLAAALTSRSKQEFEALGQAGYERFCQRYTAERVHAQLMTIYSGLCVQAAASR
jgi:glycosyltransferase involved in cell wall biosynthesis